MDTFIRNNPNVDFELCEANTYEQINNLEKKIIDVAIVRTPFNEMGLKVHKLHDEPLVFVGHKKYFKHLKSDTITLEEIKDIPLIMYRRYYDLFIEECAKLKLQPHIFCLNEDARTTLSWALKSYGIGLLPLSVAKKVSGEFEYHKLDHKRLKTKVALIWKEDQYLNHITKAFIESFISDSL